MNVQSIIAAWKSQKARRIRALLFLFVVGLVLIADGFHGAKISFIPAYYLGFLLWLILILPLFGVNIWKKEPADANGNTFWNGSDNHLYNEELQRAIEAVTLNNTTATRRALYEVLRSLTYCLPTSGPAEGDTQSLMLTKNEAGEIVLPVFSDPNALHRWEQNPHSMLVLTADKLFELAVANDFDELLINPAGPAGGKLTRLEYRCLAQGILPA